MSPVVANGCVTPEATTTWRCREVPVFGLCICGRKLCQRPTLTLKVTQNNNMMNSRRILGCTYDSDAYCFFVSSWITAARFQQRRKEQLGFYQWMVFSWPQWFSCEILLRQQSVEEQVDQPKHDSQCLLEKQCGINMKSLQKVNEDGWPSRPRDGIGARLLIVPCNRHDIKHSHATCKHSAIAYRKSLKFLCHKTLSWDLSKLCLQRLLTINVPLRNLSLRLCLEISKQQIYEELSLANNTTLSSNMYFPSESLQCLWHACGVTSDQGSISFIFKATRKVWWTRAGNPRVTLPFKLLPAQHAFTFAGCIDVSQVCINDAVCCSEW